MVFFGSIIKVANIVGLLTALHRKNSYYKIITIAMLFAYFIVAFHTAVFYWENSKTFDKSTAVLGALLYCVKTVLKILYFLHRNNDFIELYFKLKKLCDNPNHGHYKKVQEIERRIEKLTRYSLGPMIVLLFLFLSNPLFLMLYEYLKTGRVIKYRNEFPVPFANPFVDLTTTPMYEFIYGGYVLIAPPSLFFALSVDILFIATCYHISGLFGHLKEKICVFNKNSNRMEIFNQCVDYQNSVYDVVKVTQRVFGGIFFVQFSGTTIILCTQAFLITQNISGLIIYLTIGVITLAQLLMYTYCGTMIITSHEDLLDQILDVGWTMWHPNKRRLLLMVLLRYQKDARISFLNWIHCSQPALRLLVANMFNMFALMQNIKRRSVHHDN